MIVNLKQTDKTLDCVPVQPSTSETKANAKSLQPAKPMKTTMSLLRTCAAALAICTAAFSTTAFSQTTATTDPVGFVTINVTGNGGSGSPAYTFTALGMYNPVAYQATDDTVNSVGGSTTLTDPNATWTDNQYNGTGGAITYFVEILTGPGAGTTYDIIATTAATKSLTLAQPLLTGITGGDSYRIRPHWTIGSVFGATNQNGLTGGNSTTADQVLLFRSGGYVTYYYQTSGLGGTGWRKYGAPTVDASGSLIYPDDGIVIARNQSAATTVTVMGAVKTGQSSIPVLTGYTLLGNVYAASMTLANSGLYTGNSATGVAGGNSTTADQILFWNATTLGYDTYYYQTSGLGGTGWRKYGAPTVDASATSIPVGTALFINRIGGAAFNWIAPQQPTSFN